MAPEVGRARARAARRAKEVKKVRSAREDVWARRWRVATWIPCLGGMGACFSRARTGRYWLAREGWGAEEEEGAETVALMAEVEGEGEEWDATSLLRGIVSLLLCQLRPCELTKRLREREERCRRKLLLLLLRPMSCA